MLPEMAFYVNRDGKLLFSSIAVRSEPADVRVPLKGNFAEEKIFLSVLLKDTWYMRPDTGGNYVLN